MATTRDAMRTEVLHIRLTPEELKRIEQHAARHGRTVSEYARDCLQQDWVSVHEAADHMAGRLLAKEVPMNAGQLRKNLWSQVRLRPVPLRLRTRGVQTPTFLPYMDWRWAIERVEDGKVTIHNTSTNHVVDLGYDNVREFRSPDFLLLRCQLTLTERDVLIEPL